MRRQRRGSSTFCPHCNCFHALDSRSCTYLAAFNRDVDSSGGAAGNISAAAAVATAATAAAMASDDDGQSNEAAVAEAAVAPRTRKIAEPTGADEAYAHLLALFGDPATTH